MQGGPGGPGCLGGVQGVPGAVHGLRNCLAGRLRSNIQHFVQEVGYPLSVPAVAHAPHFNFLEGERGRLNLPSVQHATQGWRIVLYIILYYTTCHYIVIYYIILYNAVLYKPIPYCIILYSVMFHYIAI